MLEKIKLLEIESRLLDPNPQLRDKWNKAVQKYADEFLDDIENLKTYHVEKEMGIKLLDFPISETSKSIEELLEIIKENVDTPALNPASGGHLAYIPGGGIFPTALGDYLADVTNRYAGIFFAGPGAVRMENLLLRWMCKIVGYPKTALGNLTSGGSIANLMAITTARDHMQIKARDIEKSVIYLTGQAHHSLQKAIRIAGLAEAKLSYIPIDDRFRMNVSALQNAIERDIENGLKPFLLIASAGTTDTGAIDPMNKIAKLTKQFGIWFHVDAAYGGFFVLAEEVKNSFVGMEQADSITIDPHKGLFLAYGTGAVLIRNVEALQNTNNYQASYMQDVIAEENEPSPANLSPELTKHFRGMRMWLPLQLFGLKPFKAAISEKIWLCRYFYEEIQKIGFEVGPEPELSVAIYRYLPKNGDANSFNAKIVKLVREDGRVFLSSTTIDGIFWIRIAILCFRSHLNTIDLCLQILKEQVEILEKE